MNTWRPSKLTILQIKKVGAQILREIANQVYTDLYKQIRELVSNAVDAGATEFRIAILSDFNSIIFEDNGVGMTAAELEEQFVSLAVSEQGENPETIGRKGVGKFALLGISQFFTLTTRKLTDSGLSDEVVKAEFFFDEACALENSTKSLSEIDVCRVVTKKPSKNDKGSFTRIVCRGITENAAAKLREVKEYEKLINRLRRTLPLAYDRTHKIMAKMEPSVKDLLLSAKPTIEVYVKSPHDSEKQGRRLTRLLYGENIEKHPIKVDPYTILKSIPKKDNSGKVLVYGYILDAMQKVDPFWQGLAVRVKNVTVKEHAFFEYGDMPVMGRTTGELHICDIDDVSSITMDRSSFNHNHPEYRQVHEFMRREMDEFGSLVRSRVNLGSAGRKVEDRCQSFQNARGLVQYAYNVTVNERLDKGTKSTGLADKDEEILIDRFKNLRAKGVRVQGVREDPKVQNLALKPIGDEIYIVVPSDLIRTTTYLGEDDSEKRDEWVYRFMKGAPTHPPCEINIKNHEILLNINHSTLKGGDAQAIRIVVLLTLCHLKYGHDAELMYSKLLKLLTFSASDIPDASAF